MRLLVFPASLGLGGSQLNAIELAAAMRDRGHAVWIFAPDGPLRDLVESEGLGYLPAPERPKVRPSPAIMSRLIAAIAKHRVDLVHGYEWPPILEAAYGPQLRYRTAVVGTVMSMGVAPFIPKHLPLVVGTAQIADVERRRRNDVSLIEPPVDTKANSPVPDGGASGRAELGVAPDQFLLVIVSRLANELKREGILGAIETAEVFAPEIPIRLLIVGDGPARSEIESAAAVVNKRAGRELVTLTGALRDPRSAYAAADIAIGMGSSALRAMAFGKPLIVQGERGFWELLTPETLPTFLHQGWYGLGDGHDGSRRLASIVRALFDNPGRRAELGLYSRSVVDERFSLERAAELQEAIYARALADAPARMTMLPRLVGPAAGVVRYEVVRRYQRWRGTAPAEDFNAMSRQTGTERKAH